MREIKFRAWDKKEKRMLDVVGFDFEERSIFSKDYNLISFDDIELMQYTGLKDKNGKEIYEGDLLKWRDSRILEVRWGSVGWVLYGDLLKSFGHPEGDICSEFNTKGYMPFSEVIGNKYENPELLNKDH